jgi:hypothetical protein
MKNRCYNKKYVKFRLWGGAGVAMCERWKNSYLSFLSDMGRAPDKSSSIDRIDPFGNYEPNNCRWATPLQQSNNRRVTPKHKRM